MVARFAQYIPTCLAVIVLRHRHDAPPGGFRVPLGPVIPVAAVGLCLWLLIFTAPKKLLGGAIALVLGVPFYLLARRQQR